MEYSRMIHDYLDGELDQMQQDILFAELATNQDLRTDFNQQVKLQVVTQSDMALITPPLEATNAIFSSLGFSIPSEEYLKNLVGDTVATSPISSIKRFWSKHIALNIILLLLLLTTGTMLVVNPDFLNSNGDSNQADRSSVQDEDNAVKTQLSGLSSVPIVSSFADNSTDESPANSVSGVNMNPGSNSNQRRVNTNNAFSFNNESNPANSNVIGTESELTSNENFQKQKLFSDDELISDASGDNSLTELAYSRINSNLSVHSNVYLNPVQNRENSFDLFNLYGLLNNSGNPFSPFYVDNTNWLIQVRSLSLLNPINRINLSQSFDKREEVPWNNNLSFSALYKLNPYWAFGVEVGLEAFTQIFNYRNEDGQNNKYYQNPQLLWYGVTGRFTMPEFLWEDVVYPYAQITVGGTSVGPVVRPQIGLMVQPTGLLRLNAGLEAPYLFYRVSGITYGSGKYGLSFGGSVNF
jgi:hypothetical protein